MPITDCINSIWESIIVKQLGTKHRDQHTSPHYLPLLLSRSRCKILFELCLNHIFAAALPTAPRDTDSTLTGQYSQVFFAHLSVMAELRPSYILSIPSRLQLLHYPSDTSEGLNNSKVARIFIPWRGLEQRKSEATDSNLYSGTKKIYSYPASTVNTKLLRATVHLI